MSAAISTLPLARRSRIHHPRDPEFPAPRLVAGEPARGSSTAPLGCASSQKGSDLALVRRVLAGDTGARAQFADRARCLVRFVHSIHARMDGALDDHALADVAQDAAVTAWRTLGSFRGECSLETWLFGLARFHLANARRKEARRARRFQQVEDSELETNPGSPEEEEASDDPREQLRRALHRLPREASEVLRLRHYDGSTFEDIAQALGIPPNTARTRYHRALTRLHGLLGCRGDSAPGRRTGHWNTTTTTNACSQSC